MVNQSYTVPLPGLLTTLKDLVSHQACTRSCKVSASRHRNCFRRPRTLIDHPVSVTITEALPIVFLLKSVSVIEDSSRGIAVNLRWIAETAINSIGQRVRKVDGDPRGCGGNRESVVQSRVQDSHPRRRCHFTRGRGAAREPFFGTLSSTHA
ncbi:uncharacterized protein LOC143183439 [Calliopsis andreniformis]|uniref:uncharacterized protein LOC143183439 n=1 Tax=Calliopsis andreniformis TaxID=337506 RepID=UPI003FCD3F37